MSLVHTNVPGPHNPSQSLALEEDLPDFLLFLPCDSAPGSPIPYSPHQLAQLFHTGLCAKAAFHTRVTGITLKRSLWPNMSSKSLFSAGLCRAVPAETLCAGSIQEGPYTLPSVFDQRRLFFYRNTNLSGFPRVYFGDCYTEGRSERAPTRSPPLSAVPPALGCPATQASPPRQPGCWLRTRQPCTAWGERWLCLISICAGHTTASVST